MSNQRTLLVNDEAGLSSFQPRIASNDKSMEHVAATQNKLNSILLDHEHSGSLSKTRCWLISTITIDRRCPTIIENLRPEIGDGQSTIGQSWTQYVGAVLVDDVFHPTGSTDDVGA